MVSKKKKLKIVVNNKIKPYGQTDSKTNLIEINKKKHKGNKKELADTIKHEVYHVKHPKATEKETYKNTGKISEMTTSEQNKLVAKLRMKKINYKSGAIKRKLHMKSSDKVEPGTFINKMNESKINRIKNNKSISKTRLATLGMV